MLNVFAGILALLFGLLARGIAFARAVVLRCEAHLETRARETHGTECCWAKGRGAQHGYWAGETHCSRRIGDNWS